MDIRIMKRCLVAVLAVLSFVCFTNSYAADYSSKTVEIETRNKIKQKFFIISPPNPTMTVVLFEGGARPLKLKKSSSKAKIDRIMENGFLMRTRLEYVKQGFNVVGIDTPSDKKKLDFEFRMSSNHVKDVESIVAYLKNEYDLPVWLVGMSAGTISIAACATQLQNSIDGIVLFSSVTKSKKKWDIYKSHPNCILDLPLDKIEFPALIVYHKEDKCEATPPSDGEKLKTAMAKSPNVKIIHFEGGKKYRGEHSRMAGSCGPYSTHGYYGIENEVVKQVSDFIKTNHK